MDTCRKAGDDVPRGRALATLPYITMPHDGTSVIVCSPSLVSSMALKLTYLKQFDSILGLATVSRSCIVPLID